jgi:phenylalanyl-tRNA synthetase beta chain
MPMTVNTSWLLEYLEPQVSHDAVVDALPRVGLEIEWKQDLKQALKQVKIGFVREIAPIAAAPGYYATKIEIERGQVIPVVCASEHEVRTGWGVPVAPAGATLPHGDRLDKKVVHGHDSHGMICLDGELGLLARGSGMQHWTDESLLGKPFSDVVPVQDYLVELNVLANRPDYLGLIGIARELAAWLKVKLVLPKTHPLTPQHGQATTPWAIELPEPALCSRFIGTLVAGVKVAPSPAWLKSRLLVAGMRPINNVVDITNYVMYEWGQPLHAYDAAKLRGRTVTARRMKPGETLTLLTGKQVPAEGQDGRKFPQPPLAICDAEGPVGLGGIMGGGDSETVAATNDVLLETAYFDPVNIRRTVKQVHLGMERRGTEASYRFERGVDPNFMLEGAHARALQLIVELAGGVVHTPVDAKAKTAEPRSFTLTPEKTSRYLGRPVDAATIRDALRRLQMDVTGDDAAIRVTVPTWRTDANDAVVLIEDVARMIGYDAIPDAPVASPPTRGRRSPLDQVRQATAKLLVDVGFYETRNPSLEAPGMGAWLGEPNQAGVVQNWQSREMSVLRRSLMPSLLKTADTNLRRGVDAIRLFETDRAFTDFTMTAAQRAQAVPGRWRVAGVAGGPVQQSNWRGGAREVVDFYVLKGVVEDLLTALGAKNATFRTLGDADPLASSNARGDAAGVLPHPNPLPSEYLRTGPGGEGTGAAASGAAAGVTPPHPNPLPRGEGTGAASASGSAVGATRESPSSAAGAPSTSAAASAGRAHPYLPGAAAEVVVNGAVVGVLGELDPAVIGIDRLSMKLFGFELDLESLLPHFAALPAYKPYARLPAVTRDIAIVVRQGENYDDVLAVIESTAGAALESVALVDRYTGKPIPDGRHSLAFHLVFRDASRTLTAEEVAATMDGVVATLKEKFGAELRA